MENSQPKIPSKSTVKINKKNRRPNKKLFTRKNQIIKIHRITKVTKGNEIIAVNIKKKLGQQCIKV
jgi:hypothetical protein